MLSSHVYCRMKCSECSVSRIYQLEVNKRTGWLPLRISSQNKCKSWRHARGPSPPRLRISVRRWSHVQATLRENGEVRSAETAEEEATRQWDELLAWVKEGGGYLGPSLGERTALGQCELGDTGIMVRGLFPPEGCGAGDSLLGVPWHLALRTSELPAPYEGAPWGVTLAATVLRELAAGPTARWASYVKTLPDLVDTPALLPPAMYDEIQYIPAQEALIDFLQLCRVAHSKCPAQMTGNAAWEQFLWAMTVVHSRSFGLKGGGGRIEGDRMMLPALDMLNHGNNPIANGRLALGKSLYGEDGDKGLIHIVSTRSLLPGEQALFTYGPQERNNDDFFLYYGFTTGPNHPFEDFQLFVSIKEAIDWYLEFFSVEQPSLMREAAMEEAANVEAQCTVLGTKPMRYSVLVPYADRVKPVSPEHGSLSAASLLLHKPAPASAILAEPMILRKDGMVDARLHAAFSLLHENSTSSSPSPPTPEAVKRRCQQLLAGFSTTIEQDEVALRNSSSNLTNLVLNYRLGKKLVLMEAIKE